MKFSFSYRPGAMALGAALILAACGGGGDNPISTNASPSSASGNPPASSGTMPASSITAANAKAVAAQALFASDGLTSSASDSTTVVAEAPTAASEGLVDNSLNQMNKALSIGFLARSTGVNNVLTINCEKGGSATLTLNTANTKQFSTGDHISLAADNCADGSNVANGEITADFTNVTGVPSANSAWSAEATLGFKNVTFVQPDKSRSANGNVKLTFNQTAFRNATFGLTSDSVELSMTTPSGTTNRTLTNFSTTGSVNGKTFTYRTNFTISGNFPRTGQSSFDVTTTTDFVQQSGSDPTQGVLKVKGSDGSTLTLTAAAPPNVNIAVDSNGDGVVDMTTTATWNELAALL